MTRSTTTVKSEVIPKEINNVFETLTKGGFEAHLVGGCARDIFLGRKPKDWDFTTNATPEQIISLFPKTFYENTFGTVAVVNEATTEETLKIVEITPYRIESEYEDNRHPESVHFSHKIEDDLQRRDFTINAIAISLSRGAIKDIVDLYEGIKDIKDKTIRTVGKPDDRFKEDALRLMRAVRLAVELDFTIDKETEKAISDNASLLSKISTERIRDEFLKIIMSSEPKKGIELLHKLGLLQHIAPELERGIGVEQNQAHAFDVWEHLLRSLQHAADKGWPLDIRIAALFHDISKPETRRFSRETNQFTFYGHEVVGSRETKKILERLKLPRKMADKIVTLIRWHMFFSDTESITLSAVRRMITNVGPENIWDLMNLRICDRIGTGRPKEEPYRLRKYQAMIDEAMRDPISVGMLKIDGKKIIEVTKTSPGPKIGWVLHALLEEVLDNPALNTPEYLEKRAIEMMAMPEKELREAGEKGKDAKDEKDSEGVAEIRKKHHVS